MPQNISFIPIPLIPQYYYNITKNTDMNNLSQVRANFIKLLSIFKMYKEVPGIRIFFCDHKPTGLEKLFKTWYNHRKSKCTDTHQYAVYDFFNI